MVDGSLIFDTRIDENGFNNGVQNIGSSVSNLKNTFKKLGVAIVAAFSIKAIVNFSKECTKLAEIQTNAEVKLETIMRQRMQATNDSIQSVKDFASAQQELGVVGDEVQLSGAQQLATFLKTDEALKSLIPAMNNLAVQQNGVNVSAEAMTNIGNLMGKVMQGQTSALKRVGISFSEAEEQVLKYGNEQERAIMLAKVITNNVGEMNKALASTPAGRMQQVSNSLGDIQETLGRAVNNIFAPLIKYIEIAVSKLAELANAFENVTKKIFGNSNKSVNTGGISAVADSAEIATENLEETEEQAKKLEKRLSGFDNLNILADDEGENETALNSPLDVDDTKLANNEISEIENKIDNISKKVQDIFKKINASDFIKSIKKGIDSIDFKAISKNFNTIMQSLKPIAKSNLDGIRKIFNSTAVTMGKIIGGMVSVTGKSMQTVTGGIAKWLSNNSTKIANSITAINDNVSSGIDNIGDYYETIFDTLGSSIDRMRPATETALATMLTGFSDFGLSVGAIVSSAFDILTENISDWATNNSSTIGTFFDNIQMTFNNFATIFGTILTSISDTLTAWWNDSGATVFDSLINSILDVGATLLDIYNQFIQPVINAVGDIITDCWNTELQPIFENVLSVVSSIGELISVLWDNILAPVVDWLIKTLQPIVTNVLNVIKSVFNTVFKAIGDVINGLLKTLKGVISFLTNVFKGQWKKALQSIFDILDGILQTIIGVVKGAFNLVIDALNVLISGVYSVFSTIANIIGSASEIIGNLFGQDWGFEMPTEAPLIPHLATGTVVPAHYGEFLAVLGDNKRETEVVSPLSTIKQAMREVLGEMGGINNNSNVEYRFTAELNGKAIFDEVVKQDKLSRKRLGKSAFAR